MRAIAIVSVVMAHSRGILAPLGLDLEFLKFFAFAGVEIFFVLSGFLIGTILIRIVNEDQPFTFSRLRDFWVRRWFRTLPNYYLILVLLLILHRLMNDPVPFDWRYLLFLQNFITPHPGFFGEAWSLSVEEWFYLLFPLGVFVSLLLAPKSSSKNVVLGVVLTFIVVFNVVRFVYASEYDVLWNLGVRRMVVCRLDSIIYGVLAAWIAFHHQSLWQSLKKPGLFTGSMLMILCVKHFFNHIYPSGMAEGNFLSNTFFFTLFSLSVAMFLPWLSGVKSASGLLARSVTHMSVVSYSVYLVHFALVFKAFKFVPDQGVAALVILKYCLYWLVVMVLATLNYNFFEKPVTRLRNKFSGDR